MTARDPVREAPQRLAALFDDGGVKVLAEAGAADWVTLLGPVPVDALRLGDGEDLGLRQLTAVRDVFASRGELSPALALTRGLLALRTAALGRTHPDAVLESAAMGALLQRCGQDRDGAILLDRAWELLRSVAGGRDLRVAVVAQNVAAARLREGRSVDAEHALEVALRIRRAAAPATTALVAAQLGELRARNGRPAEAVPLLREAFVATRDREGEEAPRTLARAQMLGTVLNLAAQHAEAAKVLRPVHASLKDGSDVERTAAVSFELGFALHRTGVREEGLRRIEEAVRLTRRRGAKGSVHPSLANRVTLMAEVHVDRGRLDEAEGLLKEAIELDRLSFGDGSVEVALRYASLGQFLGRFGRADEALGFLDVATSLLEAVAPTDPRRITVVTAACRLMHDRAEKAAADRDLDLARTLLARSTPLAITVLGPASAMARSLRDLALKHRL